MQKVLCNKSLQNVHIYVYCIKVSRLLLVNCVNLCRYRIALHDVIIRNILTNNRNKQFIVNLRSILILPILPKMIHRKL